ncbi:MAG: nucleotidyltransferase domain-containing protein [Chloroflexi bacterium]|nr:nucleotidyltransferase domain-containing protein [Chloroflexota bacterium]
MFEITPEQMRIYKRTARERQARDEQQMQVRRQAAWDAARQAARWLKDKYGATRVIAFGSLAHGAWFHARSDIDLAVVGLSPDNYFPAWASLDHLDIPFEIDLVRYETAPPQLRVSIDAGVEL